MDEGQRAAQADGEVCTEAQQHEKACVVQGITGAAGNYHGNLKWMAGETQEGKLVQKGGAELTQDAASRVGQSFSVAPTMMGSQWKVLSHEQHGQICALTCLSTGK